MGSQQVLRAAHVVAFVAAAAGATANAAPRLDDRVALIDLGPADDKIHQQLEAAIVAARLEPLIGDGVDDALAGKDADRDSIALAAAMADAASKFGALACPDAIVAAQRAVVLAGARQASGLAVPELPRAWAYVLLCADRTNDTRLAQLAATHLRTLGGSPDVDARVLDRYPEVDTLSNREVVELEITPDIANADVYVDFRRVGTGTQKLVVPSGAHWIAAGAGRRRGMLTGTVVKSQPRISVPTEDQSGPWASVAEKVASWGGKLPAAAELEYVMNAVGARVALVRYGTTIEAWGHAGRGEKLHRLGDGDDGVRPLAEATALAKLIADRVDTWNDRAPDPDQPLLVETPEERKQRGVLKDNQEEPTKWWVYATIGGALLAGAIVIYANDSADNTQRIELHYPGNGR
jgi:hypothetical protein